MDEIRSPVDFLYAGSWTRELQGSSFEAISHTDSWRTLEKYWRNRVQTLKAPTIPSRRIELEHRTDGRTTGKP